MSRVEREGYGEFVGASPALRPLFDELERLETLDSPTVLLVGESGTGKHVLARTIHSRGLRRDRPFVPIDCAALPTNAIDRLLFGQEGSSSIPDAMPPQGGLLEIARGGVLFLDEIGELPLGAQALLLRAIDVRSYQRVGGTHRWPMDVGILAATNRPLGRADGRSRENLFLRPDVIRLHVPPLRERPSDVPLLVAHFLERANRRFGRRVQVEDAAMALLQHHRWPGNVRELRNVIENLVSSSPGDTARIAQLPTEMHLATATADADGCPFELPAGGVELDAVERGLTRQALVRTGWNQSAAARLLGISRYALRYRMEKFGLN